MAERASLEIGGGGGSQGSAGKRQTTFYGSLIRYHGQLQRQEAENPAAARLPSWAIAIGADELYYGDVYRATFIEFVAMVAFMVIHCSIINHSVSGAYADPSLPIAVGHFLLLGFFILSFAASSGGHINPLITWATTTTGHTPLVRALLYTVAAFMGGVIGALAFEEISPGSLHKCKCTKAEMSGGGLFLSEFFFCMGLLFVAFGVAFDARQGQVYGPILAPFFISATLGLLIFASGGMVAGYSGAGMNPVMCLAPVIVVGGGHGSEWVYAVGPLLASLVHGAIYLLVPPHHKDMYKTA